MIIRTVRHKGLRNLIEKDSAAGLPATAISKIRTILSFLQAIESEDELRGATAWKPHLLAGDRSGTWALHVTRNWRITFWVERQTIEIIDLDYEDYH